MPTITPTAPARVVRAGCARFRVSTGTPRVGYRPIVPVSYPDGHHDDLLIVEAITERPLAEVRKAKVDKPSWVLNGVGSLDFTGSTYDDAFDHLVDPSTVVDGAGVMRLIGREVQWYRDGVLYWAGVPVTGQPTLAGTVQVGCSDLGYYVTRKFFGRAERRDNLNGIGSMDREGLPGWTVTGCTKSRSTTDKARGAGSMVLSGTGAASTSFTRAAHHLANPLPIHVTAVVKVPAGTPVGTVVVGITVRGVAGGAVIDEAFVPTDDTMTPGTWQRVSTYALVPPGGPHHITVTLLSPGNHGDTGFDDVRSLINDTTGYPSPGVDLCKQGVAGLNHIQSVTRGQGPGFGFRPVIVTNTGTVEQMGERHLEHQQFQDFLSKYTDREDGFDWWINPQDRSFCFAHRRGVDHRHVQFHERNVDAGGWRHDETELSAKIVVPGEGDGVDRPEGGYADTSRTAGLMLDYFHQPPNNTPLSALDPMARQVWEQKSQPQQIPDGLSVSADPYLDILNPGDTVPTDVVAGKFRLTATVRIAKIELDVESNQLELG